MKNSKTEKFLVAFDLETTGVDVAKDRIVQYSFMKITPGGSMIIGDKDGPEVKTSLVNPHMPIPLGASEVHGIYDKDVKDAKSFSVIAPYLLNWIHGCVMLGYNSMRFDIPLLAYEFERVGFPDHGLYEMEMIDAMVLYQEYRPRTLVAATKDLCGIDIEDDAHDAQIDTVATLNVMDELSHKLDLTFEEMISKSRPEEMIDFAGKLKINDDGIAVYTIGPEKGKSVIDNPGFGIWMLKKDFSPETKKHVKRILNIK